MHQRLLKLLDDNTGREKAKVKVKQQTQPQEKSAYLQVITYIRYHNRIKGEYLVKNTTDIRIDVIFYD